MNQDKYINKEHFLKFLDSLMWSKESQKLAIDSKIVLAQGVENLKLREEKYLLDREIEHIQWVRPIVEKFKLLGEGGQKLPEKN